MSATDADVLVVAFDASNAHSKSAGAEVYVAASEAEAEQFCERWNESQFNSASNWGGYPGEAYVMPSAHELPKTADWLAERNTWEAESTI